MLRVALTGGIASGKSTVARRFAELGAVVIDTDLLAREVVAPGTPGLAAVVAAFGEHILAPDGALDRAAMRQIIFTNKQKKQELESILHPLIRSALTQRSAAAGGPYQVFEIPLLVESGGQYATDRVLVVDCDPAVQRARALTRDGVTPEQVDAILAQQATREQRLAIADDVIDNNADRTTLMKAVYALHRDYLQLARDD